MVIFVYENKSHIKDYDKLTGAIKIEVRKALSYKDPKAIHSNAFKDGRWDGRCYCITDKGVFPTGLLHLLNDLNPKYLDMRVIPTKEFEWEWIGPPIRDYQLEVVDKAIDLGRGIFEIPTRGGKTYISAGIIHKVGVKSLIVVNTVESMRECLQVLQSCIAGPKFASFGGRLKEDGDIVVGMMPSIYRNQAIMDKFKLFIVDEVHLAAAATYYGTLGASKAFYRFGCSGTPFREDKADLKMLANCGAIFAKLDIRELWTEDHVMKPIIKWVKYESPLLRRGMNYQTIYSNGIMMNLGRNKKMIDLIKAHPNDCILISTEKLQHAEFIKESLDLNGIDARILTGKSKAADRARLYSEFKEGVFKVLVATRILNTSVTIPDLSVLINAAGMKSGIELFQKIGRTMGKGNKSSVIIYDFVDDCSPSLKRHSKLRYKKLKEKGYSQVVLEVGHGL